jgi:hypothetical protein
MPGPLIAWRRLAPVPQRMCVLPSSGPGIGGGRINPPAHFDNHSVTSRRPNRAIRANGLLRPGGGMATQGRGTVSYPGSSPGWASTSKIIIEIKIVIEIFEDFGRATLV